MALQSSQRLPETAFYMKKSKRFFKSRNCILHEEVQGILQILNSPFRNPYRSPNPELHIPSRRQRALQSRVQFYIQKAKRSSSTSIHPTRPSKGIPATRPSKGIPDIPDIPVIHDIQPSRHYYMFQYFQYLPAHPGFHPITAFSN